MSSAMVRGWAFAFASLALLVVGAAQAKEEGVVGEPVKWDQARITKYAEQLNGAVDKAAQALRDSPTHIQPNQVNTWYDLKEDMRLIQNSTEHLQAELKGGANADETRATFDRIGSLRLDAEEHGRKAAIPEPVMDALVDAGAVHNLMKPYYHGKR